MYVPLPQDVDNYQGLIAQFLVGMVKNNTRINNPLVGKTPPIFELIPADSLESASRIYNQVRRCLITLVRLG